MNQMIWPTALLAILLFWAGMGAENRITSPRIRIVFILVAAIFAIPGFLFVFYYTKLLGQPTWFCEFRSWPYTELAGGGVGLLLGFVHQLRHKNPTLRRQLRLGTVPAILAVVVVVPFVKPIVRPLDARQLQERWQNGVCIQSTPSTCGPASAATILRSMGKEGTEAELARECFTYAGGTESWYLARSLRKRGCKVEFKRLTSESSDLPLPAIAGVKLREGAGHFIALLGRSGTNFVGNDPLNGKFTASLAELRSEYLFTGSFLVIK